MSNSSCATRASCVIHLSTVAHITAAAGGDGETKANETWTCQKIWCVQMAVLPILHETEPYQKFQQSRDKNFGEGVHTVVMGQFLLCLWDGVSKNWGGPQINVGMDQCLRYRFCGNDHPFGSSCYFRQGSRI